MNIPKMLTEIENEIIKKASEIQDLTSAKEHLEKLQDEQLKLAHNNNSSLRNQIKEILEASSEPMTTGAITARIQESGFTTNSKHGLRAMVTTTLNKCKNDFLRVRKGVYTINNQVNAE